MLPEASSFVVIDPSEKSASQIVIDNFIEAIKRNVDANLETQKKQSRNSLNQANQKQ
jgi:hypothetical protein